MRLLPILILFFLPLYFCKGQVTLPELRPQRGKYTIGFTHYLALDSTRTYKRASEWNNQVLFREIPVSIWYPSSIHSEGKSPMTMLQYMEILKGEEEWEYLPNEQILNWFYYSNTPQNQAHLREYTQAYLNINPEKGKFPAILYASSYQASSIENFTLCEYLASHGYVVISSPSRGTENRLLEGGTAKDMESQARDIEFLMLQLMKRDNVDVAKIATIGFSFGGLSNVLAQMRNKYIKAIVSLDGSVKYQYPTLKKSPFAAIDKVDVPFIHMAQKDIPKQVMMEDKIDTSLNKRFDFYDELIHSSAYSLKFNCLSHSYFSTLGVIFQDRDNRQDTTDSAIVASYRWMSLYTLHFLNAYLNNDAPAQLFMKNKPEENGIPSGVITSKFKEPRSKQMSFEDFHEMIAANHYGQIDERYQAVRREHPSFKAEEGKLNTLGLQLLFNRETSQHGINVLVFATKIFPLSANLFDSLAEAYLFVGNKKMARRNFEKSLELSPGNQNAKDRLKTLKQ